MNLSSASLRALVSLTEKREKLLGELSAIEAKISSSLNEISLGSAPRRERSVGNTQPVSPLREGRQRGAVKDLILAGLKEAGEAGIAVKHLATQLAIKPQNLHVWLHTTGKKSGLIEAAGKGIYRLKQTVGGEITKDTVEAPMPVVTADVPPTAKKARSRKKVKRKVAKI